MDTGIQQTSEYKGFPKKMEVYGITFFASENISDDFMLQVAAAYKELFPHLEGEAAAKQAKILSNQHRYKACLPIVTEEEGNSNLISEQLANDYSVCDIIMKTGERQAMEVYEHLLHGTTDVGLHYTFPEAFGMDQNSTLYQAMNTAIEKKYYDISSYEEEMSRNKEVLRRVTVQEFAYRLITSEWDIQTKYGPGESEWTLTTPALVSEKLLEGKTLYQDFVAPYMQAPTEKTLEGFK